MATTSSYIAGAVLLIITSAFVLVSGESTAAPTADPCANFTNCETCLDKTKNGNNTCYFDWGAEGVGTEQCQNSLPATQDIHAAINISDCVNVPTAPTPTNATTTTPAPASTNATTTTPTTASTTTPTTTSTAKPPTPTNTTTTTSAPPTNGTTTPPSPTNATTTAVPTNPTTVAPPVPAHGGMSWASFFGGIVFAAGISSVGYLVWRFYKNRQERNYHTLTTNLI